MKNVQHGNPEEFSIKILRLDNSYGLPGNGSINSPVCVIRSVVFAELSLFLITDRFAFGNKSLLLFAEGCVT